MRIHTNVLTYQDLHDAAKVARVDLVDSSEHGSRKAARAFNVKLEGESRRRPNFPRDGYGYAATWDQWGVFLAVLFERDPSMLTPYYAGPDDFATRTGDRFGSPVVVMTSDGYREVFESAGWPADAHGDHTFRPTGRIGESQCSKCTAVQRWAR